MMFRAVLAMILAIVVVAFFPPTLHSQATPSRPAPPVTQIRGQVRYPHGPTAPPGVMITLESDQIGYVAQAQTDSQGKFTFAQLVQAVYVVRARHPGFREAYQRVDLTMSPTAYIVISLTPVPGNAPPSAPGEPVSVASLAIPEPALKALEKGKKLLQESKDAGKSLGHFRKAVEIHPNYVEAHFFLGSAYMDLKRLPEAQQAFEKAIAIDDKRPAAHLALGVCFNLQGNFAAAEKSLRRGLEMNPEAVEGHFELGKAYWALGRWPEAEPHARKAVALQPDLAAAHLLLGNILLRKREAPAALQEFKEYLRLEPNGPFAASTLDLVAKIEKALASPR